MKNETFCKILFRARTRQGLTLDALGARVQAAGSTVSRWENGYHMPSLEAAQRLDAVLCLGGQLTRAWGKEKSGWSLPVWAQDFALLEEHSYRIEQFTSYVIPGLVQCRSYTQMMSERSFVPLERAKLFLQARGRRFEYLVQNNAPQVRVVLPMLSLKIPDPTVRREQIERLVELIGTGRLEVQLVPDEELPLGVVSPFLLYHTGEGIIAVSDHNYGIVTHDSAGSIEKMQQIGRDCTERAFPVGYSHRYLTNLLEESTL